LASKGGVKEKGSSFSGKSSSRKRGHQTQIMKEKEKARNPSEEFVKEQKGKRFRKEKKPTNLAEKKKKTRRNKISSDGGEPLIRPQVGSLIYRE